MVSFQNETGQALHCEETNDVKVLGGKFVNEQLLFVFSH